MERKYDELFGPVDDTEDKNTSLDDLFDDKDEED